MFTVTPFITAEVDYRREQLTRAWGHRGSGRAARRGAGDHRRGRRTEAAAASAAVAAPVRRPAVAGSSDRQAVAARADRPAVAVR